MTKFLSAPVLGMLATAMAALCQPVTTANADSIDLTIASGYPPVIDALKVMESDFFPTVEAKLEGTGHTINWNKAFAGTLGLTSSQIEHRSYRTMMTASG